MKKGDEGQVGVVLDKDAMTCDEPKRILQQAAGFYKVEQILMEKEPDDRDEAVGLAMTTCLLQAFTSELMLKCLICIERGSPPRGHDLLALQHASGLKQCGLTMFSSTPTRLKRSNNSG